MQHDSRSVKFWLTNKKTRNMYTGKHMYMITCVLKPRKATMKKTFYKLILFTVILAIGITACANKPATTDNTASTTQAASANGVVAEGHLKPEHAVNLSFQVRGV